MLSQRGHSETSGACLASAVQRQLEGELGPLSERALEADRAAVQLDEAPGERYAEPGAFGLVGAVRADLLEFLENGCMILRRDAEAGVADRDLEHRSARLRVHAHRAAVRRELHRVREQVQHDLLELALLGA